VRENLTPRLSEPTFASGRHSHSPGLRSLLSPKGRSLYRTWPFCSSRPTIQERNRMVRQLRNVPGSGSYTAFPRHQLSAPIHSTSRWRPEVPTTSASTSQTQAIDP
jgi:hypothetical protein